MTKKKEAPKPRVRKCDHSEEFVGAYFPSSPNPVILLQCAMCDATRIVFGDYPLHDDYEED